MESLIARLLPDFHRIIESPVKTPDGKEVGWHSHVLGINGTPLGGGTHSKKETSRRIALSEALERASVDQIYHDPTLHLSFLLNEIPTTCGFAFGFEEEATRMRSVFEAAERWAWHRWIDSGAPAQRMNEVHVAAELSPLAKEISRTFDEMHFYKHQCFVWLNGKKIALSMWVVIGILGNGAFPGSRVSLTSDRPGWEHGMVEAWRHLNLSKGPRPSSLSENLFSRILFFAEHSELALRQAVVAEEISQLGEVKMRIIKKYDDPNLKPGHLYRSVPENFVAWHLGGTDRFVY